MSYEDKLMNFAYKLYSKLADDPAIIDACKDQENDMIVELSIGDVPDVVWQIGSKGKKWVVNKGSVDEANAAIQYLKLKYLNDWWSGKMGADALFSQGAMSLLSGDLGDLGFMMPVEEPLKKVYQQIKGEFPGLPE